MTAFPQITILIRSLFLNCPSINYLEQAISPFFAFEPHQIRNLAENSVMLDCLVVPHCEEKFSHITHPNHSTDNASDRLLGCRYNNSEGSVRNQTRDHFTCTR